LRYHELVKRRSIAGLVVLLLTAACAAQVRGIPASVTSPRTGSDVNFTPRGIPSSVSSLGPAGLGFPSRTFVPVGRLHRNRLGRVTNVAPIPLFYGVPVYPVVYLTSEEPGNVQRLVEPAANPGEPQKIILEIRDTRPQPEAKVTKAEPVSADVEPRAETESPRVATVFIFRDGTRQELKDFAITESELIDLSGGLIKRSPLAALDRPATLKANAENGVELHFPASPSD
jgi:hypothetical protein